ncbi:MAG: TadE/TadG family protein [Sphingomonadaceae bacterium]|nr:TadE/TadG family protein [Sphingomonadaceae bacterium]
MQHVFTWRLLRSDQRGNVGFIAAASIIPLLALIGGGVDLGRAYMARTQLQSACDAGVLAGRRSMSASGQYGTPDKAKATTMFNFNFNAAAVDASEVSFVSTANDEGQVSGTANTTFPTIVMNFFGMVDFDLHTECMAELQIANADVMFVLDTTGSMGGSRIAGLRDAVRDFHKTMNEAISDGDTRIRYGFVPYSMTVNAGELMAGTVNDPPMPVSYFRDTAPYETREAQFNTPVFVGTAEDLGITYETYSTDIKKKQCNKYGDNRYPGNGSNPKTSGSAPGKVKIYTYSFHSWVGSGNRRTCTRAVQTTETTYETKFAFSNWRYKEADLDTSAYKTGAAVSVGTGIVPAGHHDIIDPALHTYADQAGYYDMVTMAKKNGNILHNVGLTSMAWSGCIEERDTVDGADWDPVPDDAYDLNLDLVPISEETRWRPMWQDLVWLRSHHQHEDANLESPDRDNAYSRCPSAMKLLTEVELSDDPDDVPAWLESYLLGLTATGNTYHDIGMIWGGRLSSPRGIFAANVNKDDKAVSRHMIFMTDGTMQPYIWGYNAYGIEDLSNRVAKKNTSTSDVTARHSARFLAACQAVKAQGTTLWVIAFGTTLTDNLTTCSSDGRAYHSSDSNELRQRFRFIASQVANLRLGQ